MSVSQPGDAYEAEADRVAEQVAVLPASCHDAQGSADARGRSGRCAGCRAHRIGGPGDASGHLHRQTEGGGKGEVVGGRGQPVEYRALSDTLRSAGEPLPMAERAFFESCFGRDFGQVSIHADDSATEAARSVSAHAFTLGHDVVFSAGHYRPGTPAGRRLLAHELTHVVQQRGAGLPLLQRQVVDDPTRMSITPQYAASLADDELIWDGERVGAQLGALPPGDPLYEAAQANLRVLQQEQAWRIMRQVAAAGQVVSEVPRPQGLPLEQGFVLQPMPELAPEMIAHLPEGQVVEVPGEALYEGLAPAGEYLTSHPTAVSTPLSAGSLSMLGSINRGLQSTGFAGAGESAIGVVAVPRWFTPGAMVPESLSAMGHTAVYARTGGQIVVVRGFGPASYLDTILRYPSIERGLGRTPAAISSDVSLFTKTGAWSIEYPVAPELADAFAKGLPEPGPVGPGQPQYYTARPAVRCIGSNCVLWAVGEAESALGAPIGPATPKGAVSVTALGEQGAIVEGTASQGRLVDYVRRAARGEVEVAPVPEAIGAPRASGMPRYLKVLKWGGRAFLVVGIAMIPVEVAMAPEGQGARTAVSATGGFLGGLGAGATAGLVCGPGAPVCSIVLGLGFGIAGYFAGRSVAEEVYDVAEAFSKSPGSAIPAGAVTPLVFRGGYGGLLRSPLDVQREMRAQSH